MHYTDENGPFTVYILIWHFNDLMRKKNRTMSNGCDVQFFFLHTQYIRSTLSDEPS